MPEPLVDAIEYECSGEGFEATLGGKKAGEARYSRKKRKKEASKTCCVSPHRRSYYNTWGGAYGAPHGNAGEAPGQAEITVMSRRATGKESVTGDADHSAESIVDTLVGLALQQPYFQYLLVYFARVSSIRPQRIILVVRQLAELGSEPCGARDSHVP